MNFGIKPVWLRNALRTCAVLSLLIFATESEASAYTDPGTGMLLWQMLAAGFVGVLFYLRKFTSWLRPKKKETKD